jgi:hypothetical protein
VLPGERLKSLPVPTAGQTARFADHVADNHSWYKHLPFFPPGASFVFFPNPHAGRGVTAEGGRFVVYDVERGDSFAHHSRCRRRNTSPGSGTGTIGSMTTPAHPTPSRGRGCTRPTAAAGRCWPTTSSGGGPAD